MNELNEHFLAPAERRSLAGRIIERAVLCFLALMNLLIIYEFVITRFLDWDFTRYLFLVGSVVVVGLLCWLILRTRCAPSRILWAVMGLSLAVRLFFVAALPTEPDSDFVVLYTAARQASAGDFSWAHIQSMGDYFYRWGYQIPFVLYEAAILRLFGSILALKLFNVLFMVGTNYLLYRIGRLFLSEKAALCVALIYALFPDTLFYTAILTNQFIALFFLLLGVLLLFRASRWWEFALAGLSLAVSDLMRPEAVVILTACLCCALLRFIQRPNFAALKRAALSLALALGCYWLAKLLTEEFLILTDVAPYGIQTRVPEWKFIVGLGMGDELETASWYPTWLIGYEDTVYSMGAAGRRALVMEILVDLAHHPIAILWEVFLGKLRDFWTSFQDPVTIINGLNLNTGTLTAISNLQWGAAGLRLLSYLLALPAPILLWKGENPRGRGVGMFCVAVVCVTICVFLVVEIQYRYRIFAVPFWLLIGGVTIEWLERRINPLAE